MSGGGGGGNSTTVQNIPDELKPLASRYTTEATKLFDTPYQGYTGQRNADLNLMQNLGLGATAQRAIQGDAGVNAASQNILATARGDYLNPATNPYLQQNVDLALGQAGGAINQQFNRPGAYGSSAHEGVMSKQFGDIATQMYGQNYAQERGNQINAWNAAQNYGQNAYNDAAQLMKAGQIYQDEAQKGLDWNYEQYMTEQDDPYKKLAAAAGVFGTNLGGSSTTQQSGGGK